MGTCCLPHFHPSPTAASPLVPWLSYLHCAVASTKHGQQCQFSDRFCQNLVRPYALVRSYKIWARSPWKPVLLVVEVRQVLPLRLPPFEATASPSEAELACRAPGGRASSPQGWGVLRAAQGGGAAMSPPLRKDIWGRPHPPSSASAHLTSPVGQTWLCM